MAARTRKVKHDDETRRRIQITKFRFYVYRLFDERGETLYVGKGCGRRLAQQKAKYQCSGEILEGHHRERDAYKRERHFINALHPRLNKHPGGNGSRAKVVRVKKYGWEREIERVGSRRYAARSLLKFDLRPFLSASKIEQIRQVANGPWC